MGNSNREMGLPDFDEGDRSKKANADENELAPVGMNLGPAARPTPVDMGKSFPDLYDRPVVEYVPPPSNLPTQVSQQESAKKNREFWSTGPADSEANAPM